jgi:NAD-dependent dihydropyrimidine dehydrogenase PreA subunit
MIPREKIPWFPTVDYQKCTGCRTCVDSCPHGVYGWDEGEKKPRVEHPYECVVGCRYCANLCPSEAISFPPLEEIRKLMRELEASSRKG